MAQTEEFGFFGSKNGDRTYSEDEFSSFYADFFTNGIKADNTSYLQVMADTGMKLDVNFGTAYINGKYYRTKENKSVTLSASDTEFDRYDVVVLRCDYISRSIYLDVVEGLSSETPEIPTIARETSTYDLGLAAVLVKANVSEITQTNIKDLRFNSEFCGVIKGVIDTISTTKLFAQYEAAWDEFIKSLGESDNVTINVADREARNRINRIERQGQFANLFKLI